MMTAGMVLGLSSPFTPWRRWWAWRPVRIAKGEWAWGCYVETRVFIPAMGYLFSYLAAVEHRRVRRGDATCQE